MPPTVPGAPAYRFGSFELDARSGELRKHGIRIKLQDQPRQILLVLLRHPGEVVTREQIQTLLWPDNTFVDFDNAINSAVRKLRDALGDNADNPRFVETLARRGYRFVAPLSAGKETALESPAATVVRPPSRRAWWLIAATVLLLGFAALGAMLINTGNGRQGGDIRVVPLTANLGLELQPSFSPDATRVAYAWNGTDRKFAIYVKLIGAGEPTRITRDLARDFSPAWSPDGRWIAALRDLGTEAAVLLIPASGGQHRELARVSKAPPGSEACVSSDWPHLCGLPYWGSLLAWSSDSKYLFTSGRRKPDSPFSIIRIEVETGEQQSLTFPPAIIAGDFGSAISPDGRSLAFVRMIGAKTADLYIAPLTQTPPIAGAPQQVTFDSAGIAGLAWGRDGRELIFSSDRRGRNELWRVPSSGHGEPVRLQGMGEDANDLAISEVSERLVYNRGTYHHGSLWKIPIEGLRGGAPKRVTATTARDMYSHFSPDGKRIVFQSLRSGVDEIWICDADGGNAFQLTSFGKGMSGSPRWSPNGKTIAFDSQVAGNWDIWVIPAEGGRPKRLTTNPANDAMPSWSRNGQWIYFVSTRSGSDNIWKIRLDGTSETQVTSGGASGPIESVDGKYLYYKKGLGDNRDNTELWKMPVGGGESTKILPSVAGRLYTVTQKGIYFCARVPVPELRYLDFLTGSVRAIAPLSNFAQADVSPDERWAEYPQIDRSSTNLMLVENLR